MVKFSVALKWRWISYLEFCKLNLVSKSRLRSISLAIFWKETYWLCYNTSFSFIDLFVELPRPENSEMIIIWSSSQAATYHLSTTLDGIFPHYPFNAKRQAEQLEYTYFKVLI